MNPDYPHSQKPMWSLIAKETLAMVAVGLLMPFGLKASKQKTSRQREQRTVVFIHGYMNTKATMYPIAVYLRIRGIKNVLFFSYKSSLGIDAAAVALKKYLRKHVRGGKIDLICHSMGGIIARTYLQHLAGIRRVEKCITIGTPHKGTYNAYWVPSRTGLDLRPDSILMSRLSKSSTKLAKVKIISVIGGSDNIVIPRVFAAHEDIRYVPDVGHMGMLFSLPVMRIIFDELTGTKPS